MTVDKLIERLKDIASEGYGNYDLIFDDTYGVAGARLPSDGDYYQDCIHLY